MKALIAASLILFAIGAIGMSLLAALKVASFSRIDRVSMFAMAGGGIGVVYFSVLMLKGGSAQMYTAPTLFCSAVVIYAISRFLGQRFQGTLQENRFRHPKS